LIEALRRPRLARRIAAVTLVIVAIVATALYAGLGVQSAEHARRTRASLKQLSGLLQDIAGPGVPAAIPALVRGWLHTEVGVVRVTVHDPQGHLLADVEHEPVPELETSYRTMVVLASGDVLRVDVVMDDTTAIAARRDLIRRVVVEGIVICLVGWALLVFAEARRAAVRRYRVLVATGRLLLSGTSELDLLRRLCELAAGEAGYALAWIGLARPDGQITPVASAGHALAYLDGLRLSMDPESQLGQGIGGRALRARATAFCNDFARDPAMAPWAAAARTHGIRASIGVPLVHGDACLGLLSLYSGEVGFFTAAEVGLAEQMAADISLGIDYLRRGASLAETIDRLARIERQIHAGSFRFRLPEGTLWCSDGAGRLFGRPTGTSVVEPPAEGALDADPATALYDLTVATTAGDIEFDVPLAPGGEPLRWLRVTGAVEMVPGGATEIRGLVQDVSERKSLEIGIARATDSERQRIASELHDNLGQILTGTSLLVTTLGVRAAALDAALSAEVRQVSELLHKALKVCRSLAHGSVPDLVHGLGVALDELARQTSATGIACEASIAPVARALHGGQAIELYRITQEAVTNALKHAGCTHITIDLQMRGRLLDLTIGDDGDGMQPGADSSGGLGHRTMRYRAARAGGTILFGPGPGGGLAVRVRVLVPGVDAVRAGGAR
jgi:signal transduction histidine kinase